MTVLMPCGVAIQVRRSLEREATSLPCSTAVTTLLASPIGGHRLRDAVAGLDADRDAGDHLADLGGGDAGRRDGVGRGLVARAGRHLLRTHLLAMAQEVEGDLVQLPGRHEPVRLLEGEDGRAGARTHVAVGLPTKW